MISAAGRRYFHSASRARVKEFLHQATIARQLTKALPQAWLGWFGSVAHQK
jgi:hypothetical protein